MRQTWVTSLPNEQMNTALDYMEACQKLAEAIGVASVFDVKTV